MTQAPLLAERIAPLVRTLYPGGAEEVVHALVELAERYALALSERPIEPPTHRTTCLITYGDGIRRPGDLIGLLALALIPAVWGEFRFNRLAYWISHNRSPERRQLEYLRQIGASADSAKEIKLFGLGDFLSGRFRTLSRADPRARTRNLTIRRALQTGAARRHLDPHLLRRLRLYRLAHAAMASSPSATWSSSSGSFSQLNGYLQQILIGFTQIAGQSLYLDDLFASSRSSRPSPIPRSPKPFPVPLRAGHRLRQCRLPLSGLRALGGAQPELHRPCRRNAGAGRRERRGQDHHRQADDPALRPRRGPHHHRRHRHPRLRLGRPPHAISASSSRISCATASRPRDNIGVGRIEEPATASASSRAAEQSLADPVIEKLPGATTRCSAAPSSRGQDLSGGEWQKLAIARAYMRDAEIIILDEPTAALDARAEAEVFAALQEPRRGHRPPCSSRTASPPSAWPTASSCSPTARSIEAGTHAELMAMGGRYAELFELQAAGYR